MRSVALALLLGAFAASGAAAGTTYVQAGRLVDVETGTCLAIRRLSLLEEDESTRSG